MIVITDKIMLTTIFRVLLTFTSVDGADPTPHPTPHPTLETPTYRPSPAPLDPTPSPSVSPTKDPTAQPTPSPQLSTPNPTAKPSRYPTPAPTKAPSATGFPTPDPTADTPGGTAYPTVIMTDIKYSSAIKLSRIKNCPNRCSGNGICSMNCTCFPGYHGVDCSLKVCPSGRAWVDLPSADNVAHGNFTECSGMGSCNRLTGDCMCNTGFTGAACDRNLCPVGITSKDAIQPCSGHDVCKSSRDRVEGNIFAVNATYKTYNEWDADMLYGCHCDDGWRGVKCDLKTCPYGDDPITTGVSETQFIDCMSINSVGSVVLSF